MEFINQHISKLGQMNNFAYVLDALFILGRFYHNIYNFLEHHHHHWLLIGSIIKRNTGLCSSTPLSSWQRGNVFGFFSDFLLLNKEEMFWPFSANFHLPCKASINQQPGVIWSQSSSLLWQNSPLPQLKELMFQKFPHINHIEQTCEACFDIFTKNKNGVCSLVPAFLSEYCWT